jgi:hypothetical protein
MTVNTFKGSLCSEGYTSTTTTLDCTSSTLELADTVTTTARGTITCTGSNTTIACTSTALGTKKCFSASQMVQLESGESKYLYEVKGGDRIMSCDRTQNCDYSPVIAIPHARNYIDSEFVDITMSSGNTLQATHDHLVVAHIECNGPRTLVETGKLTVGMCLRTVHGPDSITDISVVRSQGVYTLVTMKEFIVVNGVVASPFAQNHMATNAIYNVHRLLYSIVPPSVYFDTFSWRWIASALEVLGVLVSMASSL